MAFATTTALLPHQESATAKLLPSKVGALLMDMGTGKSRTLIEMARIRQSKWDRLFWFTPCALRDNVVGEILTHTDIPREQIAVWDTKTLAAGVPDDALVHVVGIETMSSSNRAVLAFGRLVGEASYVVVDESSYIKGHRSRRTQRITNMSARCRYRTILTGTPITQGPVDLYAQMSFLSPKILGYRSFWSFAANHLEFEERKDERGRKRRTGRIIRSHNTDYLAAKMAPYVYQVSKDECLTLPEKLQEARYLTLTAEQRVAYEEAKNEVLSIDYDDWSPIRIFHLFSLLQTIVCGFRTGADGEVEYIANRRIATLMSTIAEIPAGEPVIVWAKYRPALAAIAESLEESYGKGSVCPYHGGMAQEERTASLSRWRAGARFLVATQAIGGHGLTLTEAAYSVFFADSFKYSERLQAEDRTHRIGQTRRPVYISLHCRDCIDDRIEFALNKKGNALENFKEAVDKYRAEGLRESVRELVRSL